MGIQLLGVEEDGGEASPKKNYSIKMKYVILSLLTFMLLTFSLAALFESKSKRSCSGFWGWRGASQDYQGSSQGSSCEKEIEGEGDDVLAKSIPSSQFSDIQFASICGFGFIMTFSVVLLIMYFAFDCCKTSSSSPTFFHEKASLSKLERSTNEYNTFTCYHV